MTTEARDFFESLFARAPILPVVTAADADSAVKLAQALQKGGAAAIEITLRTPSALDAIAAASRACPDLIIGAGTVMSPESARKAVDSGARFLVSPGLTHAIASAASDRCPLLPGVATASEIMRGAELGFDTFKFFPAEAMGGAKTLKAFAGPFGDIRFCPTGGVTAANAGGYLALPNVMGAGGSWMAPAAMVEAEDWAGITALMAETGF